METEELKDIAEIPYFPFQPGVYEWLLLVLALIALLTVAAFITYRNRKKPSSINLLQDALSEVKKSLASDAGATADPGLSVKRALSHLNSPNLPSLSAKELREASSKSAPRLAKLLEILAQLEEHKYAPQADITTRQQALLALKEALTEYISTAEPR